MKTAIELNLTDEQYRALLATLSLMESGQFAHLSSSYGTSSGWVEQMRNHKFSMNIWCGSNSCGTVGCIGGTAAMLAENQHLWDGIFENGPQHNQTLERLFYPSTFSLFGTDNKHREYESITVEEAAVQLRKYLETGAHDWDVEEEEEPEDDGREWPQADNE